MRLAEPFTTGSSLMPQKRNPDSLELVRGIAGQSLGKLVALLATLKAMPTGYQKDLQENNATLFDALDRAEAAVAADGRRGRDAGARRRADGGRPRRRRCSRPTSPTCWSPRGAPSATRTPRWGRWCGGPRSWGCRWTASAPTRRPGSTPPCRRSSPPSAGRRPRSSAARSPAGPPGARSRPRSPRRASCSRLSVRRRRRGGVRVDVAGGAKNASGAASTAGALAPSPVFG